MKATKITLEDKGQDFLVFYVDNETSEIIDQQPFGTAFIGATVPISEETMMQVGKPFPIHNPPYISFGFLRYNIENIEQVDYEHEA